MATVADEKAALSAADIAQAMDPRRKSSVVVAQIMEHSHDVDQAMAAFADSQGIDLTMDEATNCRLLRKIDSIMLPVMCIVYGLNFLDKTTISYASIMGLRKDIHLKGNDYQWLGSLFYFGYLGAEYFSNRLLQRLPIGKFSACCIVAWGLVLSCFAGVNNFAGAAVIRLLLGICESAVTPGFALITSQWYTKEEQGARVGIWFSFNGFGQIFGGLVAYGVAVGERKHGFSISPWKIVFLICGLLTIVMGMVFFFVVPDSQLNCRWLNKRDRLLAIERIRKNQQGVGNKNWKAYQFKETFMDPITWLFVLYALVADIPNGGITNFFSQLIVSFGFTPEESLLFGTPGGAIEVVSLIGWGVASQYWRNGRLIMAGGWLCVALIGIILVVALPTGMKNGRLAGYYLTQCSATPFVALLSLISTNVAGYTKKTTLAACYLIAYCVGNIIGPQTFRPKDAPKYVPGEITIIVCFGFQLVILAAIYFRYKQQNQKKALMRADPDYTKIENQEFLDLTDRENPEFIYIL